MANLCQHCGCSLPWKADAFCPECGGDLDEVPLLPATPAQQEATRGAGSAASFWFLGCLSLGAAVLTLLIQSGIGAVVVCAGMLLAGVLLLTEAARRSARARKLRQREGPNAKEGGEVQRRPESQ